MNETKPKKMVGRNVATALGIICIVLIAFSLVQYEYYTSVIDDKISTIYSLETQNSNLTSYLNLAYANISQLNDSMANLQNQVNNLTDALNLSKSTVWVDGGTVNIMNSPPTYEENAAFAGYITVQVSSQFNVTVEVGYSSHGLNYENSIIVGNSGTAVFPVLPSSSISIYIFQTFNEYFILSGPLYASVTITYYY